MLSPLPYQVREPLPGLNVYGWFILQAPKGTPTPILQRLNTEVNKAMQEADVVAKFREWIDAGAPCPEASAP